MKKFVKFLCLVLCLSLCTSVLAACGGNEPVKDENQTDFYIMGGMSALSAGYDSNVVLNELAENAGITIEWDTMSDSLAEQVNIRIAGEQLPDAFQGVGFSNYDISTYGADGVFIDLTPYINADVMPNLTKILEENPDIRSAITMSDGKIYGLPAAEQMGTAGIGLEEDYSIYTVPQFGMINKAWLDELGLPVPTTLENCTPHWWPSRKTTCLPPTTAMLPVPPSPCPPALTSGAGARTCSMPASALPTGPMMSATTWF